MNLKPRWILSDRGQWVGPPVLVLVTSSERLVLDGRRRAHEHQARGLRYAVPQLVVRSHLEAVAQLVAAGHHDRATLHALEYAPHLAESTASQLERLTGVGEKRWGRFVGSMRAGGIPRKRRRSAMGVVRRALELRTAIRDGHQPSMTDIEFVLGDFLK